MKKLLFSALALAGFAACSTDGELNETIAPEQKETFTIFATQQNFDDTRVSISADASFHPTVLTWDEGDQIKLVTEQGISATLSAEDVDGKSATFRTTESVGYVENDTYYACYPASQQISTTQLLYSVPATQSGLAKDAVVLYGTGDADAETEGVQMTFKPVNSVLFISVADADADAPAPAEGFSKLEISDYDGKQILSGQVTFDGETTTTSRELVAGGTITINGTEANNYLKSVYVSLPGGVSFETGYILTYTTQSGTVMSFAFNAGTLKEGYIYEAQVKWTLPSVTLGAKTTYSYASTDPKTANSMGGGAAAGSGTTIFFNADYKSTISGVQNAMVDAMIEDCGFIVDGTYYRASEDKVTREGKEFWMPNLTGKEKTDYTVKAFIKIKHNDTIITSAPETLYVTGIPYSVSSFSSLPADWSWDNARIWQNRIKLLQSNSYFITQSSFVPKSFNVDISLDAYGYGGTLPNKYNPNIYISESETGSLSGTAIKITNKSGLYPNQASYTKYGKTITLSNSGKICVYAQGSGSGASIAVEGGHGVCVEDFSVKYAE